MSKINKKLAISENCAAVCGLFCGTCPSFLNEECGGCLSKTCVCDCIHGFRDCARDQGFLRCYQCAKFPCDKLEDFSTRHVVNGICHHKDVIKDLNLMKTEGVLPWLAQKETENRCEKCGEMIVWYDKPHKCDKQ